MFKLKKIHIGKTHCHLSRRLFFRDNFPLNIMF